jgi:hypothetical protein
MILENTKRGIYVRKSELPLPSTGYRESHKGGYAVFDQRASTQPTTLCLHQQGMDLRDTFTVNGLPSLH